MSDLIAHGFDSQERLERWLRELRIAAKASLVPEGVLKRELTAALTRAFRQATDPKTLARRNPGVSQYTLLNIKPALRQKLDQRILASANLIRLNRDASIEKTLQRFSGWATSIPAGGTRSVSRREESEKVRRGIAGLPFEERRVIIDQGHKLVASVNQLVAEESGAIAAIWHHVMETSGYQARPEHEARDGRIFVIRDNWAIRDGLMKLSGHKYTDEIEQVAELPYCRCWYEYLTTLRDLPKDMLTAKGNEALMAARTALRRLTNAQVA